jgi:hypothetical protein
VQKPVSVWSGFLKRQDGSSLTWDDPFGNATEQSFPTGSTFVVLPNQGIQCVIQTVDFGGSISRRALAPGCIFFVFAPKTGR